MAIAKRNQFDVAKASFKKKMVEAAGGSNGSPWLFCIFVLALEPFGGNPYTAHTLQPSVAPLEAMGK